MGEEIRNIRGGTIAMIFQEPMSSLTPVFSAGFHIMEAVNFATAFYLWKQWATR